jgi:putative heme-binding domain-containing protein
MSRNRIQSDVALDRVIRLAASDPSLIGEAMTQIAASGQVPASALPLVLKASADTNTPPATLAVTVTILSASDDARALPAMLAVLVRLDGAKGAGKHKEEARNAFLKAPKLENHHLALEGVSRANPLAPECRWSSAALLELAARSGSSPESRAMSQKAIEKLWMEPAQRLALIRAAEESRSHYLDDRIRIALRDPDQAVAKAAAGAARRLKIEAAETDQTPKVGTLAIADAIAAAVATGGEVALGEAVFARATCTACHTVSQDSAQKGPYLGNIADTYQRQQLAEAILEPNKTIAQGFQTNVLTLKDGTALAGFVTDEAGEHVSLRDIAAQEHTVKKADIAKRDTLPTSIMPPGLMHGFSVRELASLLDYLEALAPKQGNPQ